MGDLAGKRGGKSCRRLTHQIGFGDTGKIALQSGNAVVFGLSARNPVNRRERRQCACRGVGIRRLGIVDEKHPAALADNFHAMGKSRKTVHRRNNCSIGQADCPRGDHGTGSVLPVMRTAQRSELRQIEGLAGLITQLAVRIDEIVSLHVAFYRYGADLRRSLPAFKTRGDVFHFSFVDTDDRQIFRHHAVKKPRLGLAIAGDIAVPVEMVRRQIEPDCDVRPEPADQIELIG